MAIKRKWSGLFGSGSLEIADPAPLWQSRYVPNIPALKAKRKPKGTNDAK